MRNAQTSMAGHSPLRSGPADDILTFRSLLSETGLTAGPTLEWLLDRIETREARG